MASGCSRALIAGLCGDAITFDHIVSAVKHVTHDRYVTNMHANILKDLLEKPFPGVSYPSGWEKTLCVTAWSGVIGIENYRPDIKSSKMIEVVSRRLKEVDGSGYTFRQHVFAQEKVTGYSILHLCLSSSSPSFKTRGEVRDFLLGVSCACDENLFYDLLIQRDSCGDTVLHLAWGRLKSELYGSIGSHSYTVAESMMVLLIGHCPPSKRRDFFAIKNHQGQHVSIGSCETFIKQVEMVEYLVSLRNKLVSEDKDVVLTDLSQQTLFPARKDLRAELNKTLEPLVDELGRIDFIKCMQNESVKLLHEAIMSGSMQDCHQSDIPDKTQRVSIIGITNINSTVYIST